MKNAFHFILINPLVVTLVFLYNYIAFQDLGIAIILLTLLVRFILYPLFYKSLKQQAALKVIQPHIRRIQHEHKDNREAQGKALMALYKEHQVNPFSSFGLIIIQLPILIALYQVFLNPPAGLNQSFLSLINLNERSMIIVGIAAIAQYILGRLSMGKGGDDAAAQMMKNMVVIGPLLTIFVLYSLPSAVGLYWVTTTLFSIAQQIYINKTFLPHGTDTAHHPNIIGNSRP